MSKKSYSGNSLYRGYRKIRFIARKGTLFTLPAQKESGKIDFPARTFQIISLNSLFLFLLSYLVIYILTLFITAIAALASNIPVTLYYHGVDYIIRGKDWLVDSINIVFSSGPLIMLILSVIFIIIYVRVAAETGLLRLFMLWMLFQGLTRCFGEILVGAIMNKGFGYVILYLFIMDTGKLILTISAFLIMFTTGFFLTRVSLFSANIYFNDLRKSYKMRFILSQFIMPFFLGNIMIFLIKLPEINIFDVAVNASMILYLIPIIIRSVSIEDLYFDEDPRKIRFRAFLLIATVMLYLLFRIIFGIGIRLTI